MSTPPTPASAPAAAAAVTEKADQQADKAAKAAAKKAQANAAKEAKKAKRAAAVAARGGGADPRTVETPAAAGGATTSQPAQSGRAAAAAPPAGASGPSRHRRAIAAAAAAASSTNAPGNPASNFFSHLPIPNDPGTPAAFQSGKLHPTIVRLGVLIASGTLRGASARTYGVLSAFQDVVRDYVCPETAVFWKDLSSHISPMIAYLETCRPKGVGVGNAIRWFKSEITKLGENPDAENRENEAAQKQYLVQAIDGYISERIDMAGQVIADNAKEKVRDEDTIVVFARSSVVERALLEAWAEMQARGESFNVVVVDSRPLHEGRALLASLTAAGIPCSYTLLPLASTAIARADLVLLGASALHSDGALHSRAGTAVVAMLAKEHRVPVVACCETFKLSERVTLDDLAANELGHPDDILSIPNARKLELHKPLPDLLTPLNLLYDLTPPENITAVCTELGFVPPSSVPTLLGKSGAA